MSLTSYHCSTPQHNGASDRNRTGDNHVGNVMLYQLSYTRIARNSDQMERVTGIEPATITLAT